MVNKTLYVVIPFFNYKNNPILYKVYENTLEKLKQYKGIEIYTGEVLFPHQKESIVNHLNKNHFVFRVNNFYVLTHNLSNVVLKHLPDDWNYVVMLDSDIEFVNEDWVEKTIEALDKYSFINPYKEAIRLGKNDEEVNRIRFLDI